MAHSSDEFGKSVGAPGLLVPNNPSTINSGHLQDSKDAEGGFALWTKQGEGDKVYSTKPASGAIFKGIAQREVIHDEFVAGDMVSVIEKGQVWVKVSSDVQSGGKVYLDTNGGFVATAGTEIEGAQYLTNASNGGLALVQLG